MMLFLIFTTLMMSSVLAQQNRDKCVHHANCRVNGDTAGMCRRTRCICGPGFVNPMKGNGEPALGVCVPAKTSANIIQASWDVSCHKMNAETLKLIASSVEKTVGGKAKSVQVICNENPTASHVIVYMENADVIDEISLLQETKNNIKSLNTEEKNEWISKPTEVRVGESDSECDVYGASEVGYVGAHCVALKCASPLRLADGVCLLDFNAGDGSGLRFTSTALGFIIAGAVGLVILCVLLTICFMQVCEKRLSKKNQKTLPVEPTNNDIEQVKEC